MVTFFHHIARSAVHGWSSGTFHTPPLLFPFSLISFSSLLVRSIVHTILIIVSVPLPLVFSISFSVSGSSVSVCVSLSVFHFFPCFLIHVRFLSFFLSFFSLALSLRHGEASICVVIPVGAKDGREELRDRFVANCARPSSVHAGFILFFSLSFFLLLPIYFESIICVLGKSAVLPLRRTDDGLRKKKGNRSAPIFLWNSTSLLKSVCSLFVSFSSSFPIVHIVHSRNLVELLFVVSRPHANYADSSPGSFLNSVWKLNSYSSPPGRFSSSIVLSVWQHRIDREMLE